MLLLNSMDIYTNNEELENSFRFLNKRNIIEMNGIDNPNAFKKKNNKSDVVNLFFLARLDFSHKGVDILLKALSKLKDFFEKENCYFSIYGNGSEKELKKFNKYMNKIDSERIVYKGCIFGDEKNHMYNNQDICVLPSRYEGFPTSITEALFFVKKVIEIRSHLLYSYHAVFYCTLLFYKVIFFY